MLALALAGSALAAGPSGSVRGTVVVADPRGNAMPTSPVVVFVDDFVEPFTPAEVLSVRQANKRFSPNLLLVPVGAPVTFPNDDPIDHNVFSVSPVKTFDLGLFGGGKAKTVTFDKPGPVRIYCNIHPQMIGDILVLPNRHHAIVGSDGSYTIEGVPPGVHSVRAWFPRGKSLSLKVEIESGQEATLNFRLTQTVVTDAHLNKQGQPYPLKY